MTVLATFALIAGLAAAAAPFAQARRILRRRSSDDVSLWWLALYGAGCLVWFVYGISISSAPLIATQAFAVTGAGTALMLALHFRDLPQVGLWARLRRRLFGRRPGRAVQRTRTAEPSAPSVPAELVVEEARRSFFSGADAERALTVVDRRGRALGILRGSDIAALPLSERASLLVAELADREALITRTEVEPARPVGRRAAVAVAIERRHRLAAAPQRRVSGNDDRHTAPQRRVSADDDRHTRRGTRNRPPARGAHR